MIITTQSKGVATVTLNRANVKNAFNDQMIESLISAFENITNDESARVAVIRAEGDCFCAGADLNWMKSMATYSLEQNEADSARLARLFEVMHTLPIPLIAEVQGAAFGGGVGLVACCDIVVASPLSKFCLSEVKLGLVPATISPYVVAAMGARQAKRWALTAEIIDSIRAHQIGLVHEIVKHEDLSAYVDNLARKITKNGPQAVRTTKRLIDYVNENALDQYLIEDTTQIIAKVRVSDEGQEGMKAFFEQRKPSWSNNK